MSIYLDNNASTPLLPEVWDAMRPHAVGAFGNPASAHHAGRRARRALEDAREQLAALLGASPDEVVFTSGATEANNLALLGLAGEAPGHLVTSPVEHTSAAEPVRRLTRRGFRADVLPVSPAGVAAADALPALLQGDTRLVSLLLVNHETGALQPVAALAAAARPVAVPVHCDAVAAAGKVAVDFHALGVSTLAVSAHKFHGPVGVAALLVRRGVRLPPLVHGGGQQQGRRPGTEPVALVVGMAVALDLACREMGRRAEHARALRSAFLAGLRAGAAPLVVNGPPEEGRVPHTLNVSFPGLRADALLMALDLAGVAASAGSACASGSLLPSPTLQAMGVADDVLHSALRFSFGALNTLAEVEEAARRICRTVRRLRQEPADGPFPDGR
jgi:cysteine desulfurase